MYVTNDCLLYKSGILNFAVVAENIGPVAFVLYQYS